MFQLRLFRLALALFALIPLPGCDEDLSRDYALSIRVSSAPDRAVEGARASLQGGWPEWSREIEALTRA